jgi:hypothetical protein
MKRGKAAKEVLELKCVIAFSKFVCYCQSAYLPHLIWKTSLNVVSVFFFYAIFSRGQGAAGFKPLSSLSVVKWSIDFVTTAGHLKLNLLI